MPPLAPRRGAQLRSRLQSRLPIRVVNTSSVSFRDFNLDEQPSRPVSQAIS
jgi:hypothetical protein